MIKFSAINALVHYVSAEIEIPSKSGGQSFIKRELIIDDSWERDGRVHPNFVLVEFTGDKMAMLNGIVPGHRVNLEGMLTGREYNGRVFNTAKGLSVSFYQAPQQPQQQQGTLYCEDKYPKPAGAGGYWYAPGCAHPPNPQYGSSQPQQAPPAQQQFPQYDLAPQAPQTAAQQPAVPGVNNLPFDPA